MANFPENHHGLKHGNLFEGKQPVPTTETFLILWTFFTFTLVGIDLDLEEKLRSILVGKIITVSLKESC